MLKNLSEKLYLKKSVHLILEMSRNKILLLSRQYYLKIEAT